MRTPGTARLQFCIFYKEDIRMKKFLILLLTLALTLSLTACGGDTTGG